MVSRQRKDEKNQAVIVVWGKNTSVGRMKAP
jgi:hypothetical protein